MRTLNNTGLIVLNKIEWEKVKYFLLQEGFYFSTSSKEVWSVNRDLCLTQCDHRDGCYYLDEEALSLCPKLKKVLNND